MRNEDNKIFSDHLITLRKERFGNKHGCQKLAAKGVNIIYTTYRNYEKKIKPSFPSAGKLVKIKEGFNISFEELFEPFIKDIDIDKEFSKITSNLKVIKKSDKHWLVMKNMIQLCYQSIKDRERLSKKRDTSN